jgi:hypothetical protein
VSSFRCLLVPLTAAWLSVQVLVTTGSAILAFTSGISPSDIVCTCAHGADHGSCPMHRTSNDSTRCRLQDTQDVSVLAWISVLSALLVPETVDDATPDASSVRLMGYVSPFPSDWIVPPEPPPPRS